MASTGIYIFIKNTKKPEDKSITKLITTQNDGFEKLIIPEKDRPFFELQTEKSRKFGILPQETFILKSLMPVSLDFINQVLSTQDNFSIEKTSENEFKIMNKRFLGLDQPLTISLATQGKQVGGYVFDRDYSWSFQSQGKFRVVNTIPGNEKTKVPLNTGIEITFSQDEFADPTKYIEISPNIKFETKTIDETCQVPTLVYTLSKRLTMI